MVLLYMKKHVSIWLSALPYSHKKYIIICWLSTTLNSSDLLPTETRNIPSSNCHIHFLLHRSFQRICLNLRPCVTFHNKPDFYGEKLLAPCPTPNLEDHPLSDVFNCFFNIFVAILHIWRPSPSATQGCAMPWWQGLTERGNLPHRGTFLKHGVTILWEIDYFKKCKCCTFHSNSLFHFRNLFLSLSVKGDERKYHSSIHTNAT